MSKRTAAQVAALRMMAKNSQAVAHVTGNHKRAAASWAEGGELSMATAKSLGLAGLVEDRDSLLTVRTDSWTCKATGQVFSQPMFATWSGQVIRINAAGWLALQAADQAEAYAALQAGKVE